MKYNMPLHVAVEMKLFCSLVHLKYHLDELSSIEETTQCTEDDLDNVYNIILSGGRDLF